MLRAREEGLRRFSAAMSPENEPSHRLMRRVGRVLRDVVRDGEREIVVEIPDDPTEGSRTRLSPLATP